MLLAYVALSAFLAVSLTVSACRTLRAIARADKEREAARRDFALRRHKLAYTGPLYNAHGREIG